MHLPSTTVQAFLQLCGRLTRLHVTTSRFPDRGDDSQDIDWLEGKKTGGAVLGGRKDRESYPLPMMSKGEIVERFVIDVKARARPRSNGQLSLFVLFVDGNFGMTKQHQRHSLDNLCMLFDIYQRRRLLLMRLSLECA